MLFVLCLLVVSLKESVSLITLPATKSCKTHDKSFKQNEHYFLSLNEHVCLSFSLMFCALFCRSGLEQDDMRILYKYLTTSLFPRHTEPEVRHRLSISTSISFLKVPKSKTVYTVGTKGPFQCVKTKSNPLHS